MDFTRRLAPVMILTLLSLTNCSRTFLLPAPSDIQETPTNTQNTPFPDSAATENSSFVTPSPIVPTALPSATEFSPTRIPTPTITQIPTITPLPTNMGELPFLYTTQAGDTLETIAIRFGVEPDNISSPDPLPPRRFLPPGQLLIIPSMLKNTTSHQRLLPDSEIVFSLSAIDFDIIDYVSKTDGYLSTYREYLHSTGWTSGAQIIARISQENSINPRLLLALLQYQSNWVYDQPGDLAQTYFPMGNNQTEEKGLYKQLSWAVNQLSIGYYGWREGLKTEIIFHNSAIARLAPDLNAGTVALQYYFAQVYDVEDWLQTVDPNNGFVKLHKEMFGNPWIRAQTVEPLYPPNLTQPQLILPFLKNQPWSYTGGPHGAWEHDGARAAIDFAPGSSEPGCIESQSWIVAAASGLVLKAKNGVLLLDLDGDGIEQTGWVLLYLHITTETISSGKWVERGDLLGHPSCLGGYATGTHLHFARKYNGEWISADGPIPFEVSGWIAVAGEKPYQGSLIRDGKTIEASPYSMFSSRIVRSDEDPY